VNHGALTIAVRGGTHVGVPAAYWRAAGPPVGGAGSEGAVGAGGNGGRCGHLAMDVIGGFLVRFPTFRFVFTNFLFRLVFKGRLGSRSVAAPGHPGPGLLPV
jgi:hypothetical protein